MTSTDSPSEPPLEPTPIAPRQKFPSGKQALVGCLGSVGLMLTSCAVMLVFDVDQANRFGVFLIVLALFVYSVAPVAGLVVVIMYFVRRRTNGRQENPAP